MDRFIQCVVLSTIVLTFIPNAAAEISLEKRKLFSDEVEILIPQNLNAESRETAKFKPSAQRRPPLVYSDPLTSVNLAFEFTGNAAENTKIRDYKETLASSFENMYPDAEWLDDDMISKNEKNVGYLELITPTIDAEIYNLIFFTEVKGKLFLCAFNCPKKLMGEWKPIAWEIMQSLSVRSGEDKT